MKYTPTDFDSSVNISKSRPVLDFLQYLFAITAIVAVIYFLLSILVDWAVQRISPEQELKLWKSLVSKDIFADKDQQQDKQLKEQYVQAIFNKIPKPLYSYPIDIEVGLIDQDYINAFAFPGGQIRLTTKLFNQLQTENGLTFVLGHELGHFMARDHLRGLGKGVAVLALSTILFGADSSSANFITNILNPIQNKFSQQQELKADKWGLKVLHSVYGHMAGYDELFELFKHEHKENKFLDFFATHPVSDKRISILQESAVNDRIGLGQVVSIPADIKSTIGD